MGFLCQWSLDLGLPGLGILSFTEAFIQPIPPEALTLPMFIDAQGDPWALFLIWSVVTLTSVAGALLGWWLGKALGRSVAERFIARKHIVRLDNLIVRYGTAGMFIAAISPIPYKVLAWVAGMGEMDRRQFIIAGLWGRGFVLGRKPSPSAFGVMNSYTLCRIQSYGLHLRWLPCWFSFRPSAGGMDFLMRKNDRTPHQQECLPRLVARVV
ncbi:MAG: hypothetical protein Ct9H90mP16_16300 [Candidatus Poseidoniales archaeon]|nr:MAG: hypothetical protein Ct9H90mP16_16300 [Candidatus Poseidoniales archaeon]